MITPLRDWYLLEPAEQDVKLKSGLVLAPSDDPKLKTGKVVAHGSGQEKDYVPYPSAGAVVFYDSYGVYDVMDSDGKKFTLVPQKQIVAVIA